MEIRTPKATGNIMPNGKMICLGTKSVDDAKIACKKLAKTIKNLGYPVKFTDFTIQNIVGSFNVPFQISLTELHTHHGKFCTYNPEVIAGLYYSVLNPKMKFTIFESGKVMFMGATNLEDIHTNCKNIYPILKQFQKYPENTGNDIAKGNQ